MFQRGWGKTHHRKKVPEGGTDQTFSWTVPFLLGDDVERDLTQQVRPATRVESLEVVDSIVLQRFGWKYVCYNQTAGFLLRPNSWFPSRKFPIWLTFLQIRRETQQV